MSFWIITHCMIATSASDTDHQTKSQIWLLILNFQNQKNDFGIYKFKIKNLILFLDFEGVGVCITFIYILMIYDFQNPKSDFVFYIFKIKKLILEFISSESKIWFYF